MRKRYLMPLLGFALAAAAMAAAVSAPAEVLDNLDFFSDFELLSNLEILEVDAENGEELAVSTVPVPAAAAAALISTETVKVSTFTRRSYEKL